MTDKILIDRDLLQRLVDAAYDFHPANKAADEGQEILDRLEAKPELTFNDQFLRDVIEGECSRNIHVIQKWCEDNGYELVAKKDL